MKQVPRKIMENEILLTDEEFLQNYNNNMPSGYPQATIALLHEFKKKHPSLFNLNGLWTLDQHRKRLIDWLPQNLNI